MSTRKRGGGEVEEEEKEEEEKEEYIRIRHLLYGLIVLKALETSRT